MFLRHSNNEDKKPILSKEDFLQAIANKDCQKIKAAKIPSEYLELKDERGRTPLLTVLDTGYDLTSEIDDVYLKLFLGGNGNIPEADGAEAKRSEENNKILLEMVDLLLQNDVNVDAKDNQGKNALYYALTCAPSETSKKIMQKLLDHGADINAKQDCYKNTVLYNAYSLAMMLPGKLDMVKFLMDRGSDCTLQFEDQESVLSFSLKRGTEILQLYLQQQQQNLEKKFQIQLNEQASKIDKLVQEIEKLKNPESQHTEETQNNNLPSLRR